VQNQSRYRDDLTRSAVPTATMHSQADAHSQSASKRICLFGLFGMENYGNDGSLEAILLFLRDRWPRATFSCVCIDPAEVERAHNVASMRMSWRGPSNRTLQLINKLALTLPQKLGNWLVAIRHLRNFDVLMVPGTSPLCDYRAGSFGAPYAIFRWALSARLARKPLFFVSVGAGPIEGRLSRWMLTYVVRSAAYRSFRDENSKGFIASLGIDTRRDEVYPDLAFKLPVPLLARSSTLTSQPVTIGVGLIDYNGWHGHARPDDSIYQTYLAKMTHFVATLLERGYRIRLLVGESADQRAIAGLQAALWHRGSLPGAAAQIVVEPVGRLDDVMRQLADTSIVIASRFHNIICSLKAGRPTISVGYQAKNDALMAKFGLDRFCQHIEHFDTELLLQQVTEMLRNPVGYEDMIKCKLMEFEEGIRDQERALAQVLFAAAGRGRVPARSGPLSHILR